MTDSQFNISKQDIVCQGIREPTFLKEGNFYKIFLNLN